MALDRPIVRAPEFSVVDWLNASEPPTLAGLRGRPVLIDIWDFSCINCLRTLPTLRDWHQRYEEAGLAVIGVHTPEFPFEREPAHVQAALGRLGIRWPVALDNEQTIWTAYANRAWPSLYLVDSAGYLRFRHAGEGDYARTENAIREVLIEAGLEEAALPPSGAEGVEEHGDGAVCLPATPELHAESLGNGPVEAGRAKPLALPHQRPEGSFYADGEWKLVAQGLSLVSGRGEVVLPFRAAAVHAVMSPFSGAEAPPSLEPVPVEAWLDEAPVGGGHFGRDLYYRETSTWLQLDAPRLYDIADGLGPGRHELRMRCAAPGWTLYAFTFRACLDPSSIPGSTPC